MDSPVFVRAEGLSKRFCRDLRRSLWYGLQDLGLELRGSRRAHIHLRPAEFWALDGVSFELARGEILGVVGPNGAGKSTLLKLLNGLIRPDRGTVRVRGRVQALIELGTGFNPVLSGRENVWVNAAVLGIPRETVRRRFDEIVAFSGLEEFIDMPVQYYSSGMKVRLGFSVATCLEPDILLIDEVLSVGDAAFQRKARDRMLQLLHSGISVVFVSHSIDRVESLCDRCLYLSKGRVRAVGPTPEVLDIYARDRVDISGGGVAESTLMARAELAHPDLLVFERLELRNERGEMIQTFETGEEMHCRLWFRVKQPIRGLTCAVRLRSDQDVWLTTTTLPNPLDVVPGPLILECRWRNVLREGGYAIDIEVEDYGAIPVLKCNQAMPFEVRPSLGVMKLAGWHGGVFVLSGSWSSEGAALGDEAGATRPAPAR